MDYLCELPNDAARRKALGSLPPDLNSTYERILSRVNQSNPETQKLVRRALRWIAHDHHYILTIEGLCEATSIDFGDTKRNSEAVPNEFEVLRWCSSLVRKSVDHNRLELAHFTVLEFLRQIDPVRDISLGAYRIDPKSDRLIFAKVCLTYLNLEDFDQCSSFNQRTVESRFHEYPFRRYAIGSWSDADLDDTELFSLVQKLLNPSKPHALISWAHDMAADMCSADSTENGWLWNTATVSRFNTGFAQATALHYAAILGLPTVCTWLLESGCDVNRSTTFGTPLHCAVMGWEALYEQCEDYYHQDEYFSSHEIIGLFLEAGADLHCYYHTSTYDVSPLQLALKNPDWDLASRLLSAGGILDDGCLDILEEHVDSSDCSDICKIVENITVHNLRQENRSRLLQLALIAETPSAALLMQRDMDLPGHNTPYEKALRTAAEFGQEEIVKRLLEDHRLDIDAADESTGLTALHEAVITDQLGVAQILLDQGANLSKPDSRGRTALHHSVQGREVRCLELLLHRNADASSLDLQGMTVWHLAAHEGNAQALRILMSRPDDSASAIGLKANDGRTPLLCASASVSKEPIEMLLRAGSNLTETASDGCSPLHYAAESGRLENVAFLLGKGLDPCTETNDGSNTVHCAVMGDSENPAQIIRTLLENGVNPRKARNDGCTPLDLLVKMIEEMEESTFEYSINKVGQLFAAINTLARKMLENPGPSSDVKWTSSLMYLACLSHYSNLSHYSKGHETVLALVELGLDCNIPSPNGETALMAAAKSGNGAILSKLLAHGANPCVYSSGRNAIHSACLNGHKEILVSLRQTSIDWDSKSEVTLSGAARGDVTALHIASQLDDSSVLEYLLEEGLMSDIDARTSHGETPLFLAAAARAPQNVSLLLSNSADTTIVDDYGNNAIHWAADHGFGDIISEFIRHGSDLGLPNSIGLTPELVARKYGYEALAKIIMDYVNEQSEFCHPTPIDLSVSSDLSSV